MKTLTRDRRTQKKIYLQIGISDFAFFEFAMLIARGREEEKGQHAHSQRDREAHKGLLTCAPKDRECNALWTRFGVMVEVSWRPFRVFWRSFGHTLEACWGQKGGSGREDNSDVQKGPSPIFI